MSWGKNGRSPKGSAMAHGGCYTFKVRSQEMFGGKEWIFAPGAHEGCNRRATSQRIFRQDCPSAGR